ncbi:MAG: polysaccharide deacetylase family protein [Clostridia bacterium]|nr:polysaccharide deacetylase family protein [Clostridia bacterium]
MKYRFMRFPEGKTKAVTFSYDDGCRQDLRTAEILNARGLKGTFNINSARIAANPGSSALSEEEIREHILGKGHEAAVHGEWHKAPGKVRPIDGIRDILNCRLDMEKRFARIIRGMAYPDSGITAFIGQASYEGVKNYLMELDIAYARTVGQDNNGFELPTDWYQWMPTAHHNHAKLIEWAQEFTALDVNGQYGARRNPRLFYLWGHSFEFDRDKNWDRFETVCDILAGKEDIWYAVNMDICAYAKAYDSLVFSADGRMVYNPGVQTIWFDDDGELCCVKAGETLVLA